MLSTFILLEHILLKAVISIRTYIQEKYENVITMQIIIIISTWNWNIYIFYTKAYLFKKKNPHITYLKMLLLFYNKKFGEKIQ